MVIKEMPRHTRIAHTELPINESAAHIAREFVKTQIMTYIQESKGHPSRSFISNALRASLQRLTGRTPETAHKTDVEREVLWTSEAVTNVFKYGKGAEKVGIGIGIVKGPKSHKGNVLILVEDTSHNTEALAAARETLPKEDAVGGRGLYLMAEVSADSGIQVYPSPNTRAARTRSKITSLAGRKIPHNSGFRKAVWGEFQRAV